MTKHHYTREEYVAKAFLAFFGKAQNQSVLEPAWLFSKKRPAPTLEECSYTVPECFTLDVIERSPNRISTTAHFCYNGKSIAFVSWYQQKRVSAFLIHLGYIVIYESLDEAINKLIMHTFQLRLHGVI